MLALAIETSNPSAECGAGVAFGEIDGDALKTLDSEPVRRADRHSDDLMPAIDRLAARLGVGATDIRLTCVSAGPGGYTGLRIAVVVAQSIAEVGGGSCIGVPTELVVAKRAPKGRPFAVCLASKGPSAYVRAFDAEGEPSAEGRVVDDDAILSLDVDVLVADRFLPERVRAQWPREIAPPTFDPFAVLEASIAMTPADPAKLRVLYRREPDAVTQWRRLHGGS